MKKLAFLVLAALPAYLHAQTDDFNDNTDLPEWTRYNPIGVGSFSVANGAYRIQAARTGSAANPGRAGSLRQDVTYADFYITVDIVDWNTNLNQAFGLIARATDIGPGATDGYAMTWDRGGGDLDISRIVNENPSSNGGGAVPVAGNDRAALVGGKVYRMVFIGRGAELTGQIYEMPNLRTPLASITGTDATFASGVSGLITYDNASAATQAGTDTTFDNYFALSFQPPRLDIQALDFGDMLISWPIEPTNYVLQATTTLGTNWADITEDIGEDVASGRRSYTDNLFLRDLRFYRLRP